MLGKNTGIYSVLCIEWVLISMVRRRKKSIKYYSRFYSITGDHRHRK